MSMWSLTYQQSAFRWHHSTEYFIRLLPTRWRLKPHSIDTERNYVTVTRCIVYADRKRWEGMQTWLSWDAAVSACSKQSARARVTCRSRKSRCTSETSMPRWSWWTSSSRVAARSRRAYGNEEHDQLTEWWGAGVVVCLERGADLHTAQLTPLPLTVSCFKKMSQTDPRDALQTEMDVWCDKLAVDRRRYRKRNCAENYTKWRDKFICLNCNQHFKP